MNFLIIAVLALINIFFFKMGITLIFEALENIKNDKEWRGKINGIVASFSVAVAALVVCVIGFAAAS